MSTYPALSIRQPWAELILLGKKTIEIRNWSTEYRGPIWLHTGAKVDEKYEKEYGFTNLFKGGYIGTFILQSIVPLDSQRWYIWKEYHLNNEGYVPGYYAWIIKEPSRLAYQVEAKGKLGLFYFDKDIEERLIMSQKNE